MRYAIISDIHSNLEALKRVLEQLKEESINKYVCLGDIVGYAANPNECVDTVRALTDMVIAGNHDYAAVRLTDISFFNPVAAQAAIWTGKTLTHENKDYLTNLGLSFSLENLFFVHSSPRNPELWYYVLSLNDAKEGFSVFEEKICFLGHTHQPITFTERAGRYGVVEDSTFAIKEEYRYMVNVGSIGQPRDSDPRACYVIYDTDEQLVEIRRLPYEVETAQEKIRQAGLPEFLARRLELGR